MVAFRDQFWPVERLQDLSTKRMAALSLQAHSCRSLRPSKSSSAAVSQSSSRRNQFPRNKGSARWTAARFPVGRLHHSRLGMNPKTLANHKSNVRAALLWFGNEQGVPSRGMPLIPDWRGLHQQLTDRRARSLLSSLMRYCSARRIAPLAVDEVVVDGY